MEILVVSPEAGNWQTPSPLSTAVNRLTDAFAQAGVNVVTCSPFFKNHIQDAENYKCIFRGTERLQGKVY